MLQDPQVLGNDHNKPHSLMSDPISTMYFHNMFCDLLNKILFKPTLALSYIKSRPRYSSTPRELELIRTEFCWLQKGCSKFLA